MVEVHKSVDERLSSLAIKDPTNLLFLCGAGISLDSPTSLPTVYQFIFSILKECGLEERISQRVQQQFMKTNYRFESLIDEIRKNCDGDLVLSRLFNSTTYNKIHYFLAKMLQMGATVITTNFDNCIENAILQMSDTFCLQHRLVYTGNDLDIEKMGQLAGVLVKIHGSHPLLNDKNTELIITVKALAKTAKAFAALPNWRQYILNLINDKTIIIMGYSCSDDFDVVPLLADSRPQSINWINFDYKKPFPISSQIINNEKVKKLQERLPLIHFDGQLTPLLKYWSNMIGISITVAEHFTVSQYISSQYPDDESKMVLCNEILLSYGLYDDISIVEGNPILQMQNIKAQFRLGNYNLVIKICHKNMENHIPVKVLMETLYYLSSALYFTKDYREALKISFNCCIIACQVRDMIFYLNCLINYASIQYMFASTLSKDEQGPLLNSAVRKYHVALRRAKGISIEAEANALWGLGDIERYRGNIYNAKKLLEQALEILMQIGNTYAISQLITIIKDLS